MRQSEYHQLPPQGAAMLSTSAVHARLMSVYSTSAAAWPARQQSVKTKAAESAVPPLEHGRGWGAIWHVQGVRVNWEDSGAAV